jgi:kumamolisin
MNFRTRTRIALVSVLGLLALLLGIWHLVPGPRVPTSSGSVTVAGNTPTTVGEAQMVRHGNPESKVTVVVGLKLRNERELDALLASQADSRSANFRKYITPEEFTNRFAPTQSDYDLVVAYLKSNGLNIVQTYPNRLIIVATGNVSQMENTFSVTINEYSYMGVTKISNDADPRVPSYLQGIVQSVIGLNNFAEFHNMLLMRNPQPKAGSGPSGFTPPDIATAYNYPNANNKLGNEKYTGAGRTVAIATAYNYDPADVNAFWKQFGITRTGKIVNVPVAGTTKQLNGETTLDLQQVGAQAPGADIMMYMGVDPAFTTFTMIFNQIATDNKADVVSISWGLCETGTGPAQMLTENAIFKQMESQGMAVFAASGDDGAYDCKTKKPLLSIDYPSSDPQVTAVGGTTLVTNDDGTRQVEIAWSGGGGGISDMWTPQPAWQSGPGVPTNGKRNSADVSLVSDPWTGYALYFQGSWMESGGTSFAAPDWAALWTLCDEGAGRRVGNTNATLYRIGRSADYKVVFSDITGGNNGDGRGPGYKAGTAWDHPTGWGVPNGSGLLYWLKSKDSSTD